MELPKRPRKLCNPLVLCISQRSMLRGTVQLRLSFENRPFCNDKKRDHLDPGMSIPAPDPQILEKNLDIMKNEILQNWFYWFSIHVKFIFSQYYSLKTIFFSPEPPPTPHHAIVGSIHPSICSKSAHQPHIPKIIKNHENFNFSKFFLECSPSC